MEETVEYIFCRQAPVVRRIDRPVQANGYQIQRRSLI
jgi:hypothetical protein